MNDQDEPEASVPAKAADALNAMADKVRLNASNGYGGAFVIAAPDGTLQELLLLDNTQDLARFWSLVQSAAVMAIDELKDNTPKGFGRR